MSAVPHPTLSHVLIIKDHSGPKAYWLTAEMYTVGRDPSSSIQLDSQYISRSHAILFKSPSEDNPDDFVYQLLDGDIEGNPSTNGIYVNGEQVDFRDLQDGDEVQFGFDVLATYCIQEKSLEDILSTLESTQIVTLGSES
jgi:pSer/pThr/pTyr-binding forkhead associated (FHA) protein